MPTPKILRFILKVEETLRWKITNTYERDYGSLATRKKPCHVLLSALRV